MSILSHARAYRDLGMIPIPVKPRSKKPAVTNWLMFEPTDENLERHLSDAANLGVLTGLAGVVEIDLDHPAARVLAPSILPETGRIHGRGGAPSSHPWYRISSLVPTKKFADPVDGTMLLELRGDGGMTVVPPSVHPTGEPYLWESEGELLEVDTDRFLALIARLAAATLLAKHWPERGSRHNASLSVGGMLARADWDREQAAEFVRLVARAAGDEEFEARAENARTSFDRTATESPVVGAPTLAGIMDERVVRRAAEWLGLKWRVVSQASPSSPALQKPAAAGLAFVSIGDLLAQPVEEVRWLIEGRLSAGGTSLVVAKPKAGKSTLARALALAVSRGDPWLGWAVAQGPVIYLALEEKKSEVAAHFRAMGATGPEPIQIVFGPTPKDALRQLEAEARGTPPALIIVDTLQRLVRVSDLNDYSKVTAALDPLLHLARETGAHVQFLHHARKGFLSTDGDGVLGSTAILGTVDTAILVRRTERARSLWTIQRYGDDLEETVFELDPVTRTPRLTKARKAFESERLEQLIVRALRDAPETSLTEQELNDRVPGRTEYKRPALRRLVERGDLVRTGTGTRGAPYRYAFPGRLQPPAPVADSRSLVPMSVGEHETRMNPRPEADTPPSILVPCSAPRPGNKGTSGTRVLPDK